MNTRQRPARYAHEPAHSAVPDWMAHGACATTTIPDAWHPDTSEPTGPEARHALKICAGCPVRTECRDYALARPWLTGIWGATTHQQRHQHRRGIEITTAA